MLPKRGQRFLLPVAFCSQCHRFESVQSVAPAQLGHQSDYYGLEPFRVLLQGGCPNLIRARDPRLTKAW